MQDQDAKYSGVILVEVLIALMLLLLFIQASAALHRNTFYLYQEVSLREAELDTIYAARAMKRAGASTVLQTLKCVEASPLSITLNHPTAVKCEISLDSGREYRWTDVK